jgi:hypothetical protein
VLDALAARDPEADELEAALLAIVEDLGPPTGPTRSIALAVYEEWQAAVTSPGWVEHLLGEAVEESGREGTPRGRQLPA